MGFEPGTFKSLVLVLVLSCGGSYIDAQELLLQHMFLGCNYIYKHLVETKNKVL